MNIVACCKFVPDVQDISVGEGGDVNFDRAKWEISEFDLQAVEAGAQLAEATDGKFSALSCGEGRANTAQLRKDLLSRGPEELRLVCDDALADAHTHQVAKVLAHEIADMAPDLVLCGEGSADYYYKQTAIQVGTLLGWNTVVGVDSIEANGSSVIVERVTENRVQRLEVELPAVIGVTSSINTPPLPTMKKLLAAGKKPFDVRSADEAGGIEPSKV